MTGGRPRPWRLFVAVTPPPAIQAALGRLQADLARRLPAQNVKWALPSQIHLTLRFLGDVRVADVDDVLRAVVRSGVARQPFVLSVAGLGAFPDARRPRVLWAGLHGALDALHELRDAVFAATAPWGEHEHRPFEAHLTLGRIREFPPLDEDELAAAWAGCSAGRLGSWTVSQAELVRSQLTQESAVHSRIE
jgi:2'-5' RNA ligase